MQSLLSQAMHCQQSENQKELHFVSVNWNKQGYCVLRTMSLFLPWNYLVRSPQHTRIGRTNVWRMPREKSRKLVSSVIVHHGNHLFDLNIIDKIDDIFVIFGSWCKLSSICDMFVSSKFLLNLSFSLVAIFCGSFVKNHLSSVFMLHILYKEKSILIKLLLKNFSHKTINRHLS